MEYCASCRGCGVGCALTGCNSGFGNEADNMRVEKEFEKAAEKGLRPCACSRSLVDRHTKAIARPDLQEDVQSPVRRRFPLRRVQTNFRGPAGCDATQVPCHPNFAVHLECEDLAAWGELTHDRRQRQRLG